MSKAAPPPPRPPQPQVRLADAVRRCGDEACATATGASRAAVADAVRGASEVYASVWEAKFPGCSDPAALARGDPTAFAAAIYCSFRGYNSLVTDDAAAARFEAAFGANLLAALPGAPKARNAHASVADLSEVLDGCGALLRSIQEAGLCSELKVTPVDGEDLAELREYKTWGDENKDAMRPPPQVQFSALLVSPPELKPRLLLETQARRLGLRVLPDIGASALRAYLTGCRTRPIVEEYFVDDVYRTAFDQDDYTTVQLEVLVN